MSGGGSFSKSKGAGGRDPNQVFSQLASQLGPAYSDLLDTIEGRDSNKYGADIVTSQEDLLGRIKQMTGGSLQRSALGSTDSASVAAAQVAKTSGGRGGGAFGGGGATALATRAAQGAASSQGAALDQVNHQSKVQLAQLEAGVSDSLQRGKIAQAGLFEQRQSVGINARTQFLDILGGMAKSGLAGTGGSASTRARGESHSGEGGVGGGKG